MFRRSWANEGNSPFTPPIQQVLLAFALPLFLMSWLKRVVRIRDVTESGFLLFWLVVLEPSIDVFQVRGKVT